VDDKDDDHHGNTFQPYLYGACFSPAPVFPARHQFPDTGNGKPIGARQWNERAIAAF
jgi:hypothetical protein